MSSAPSPSVTRRYCSDREISYTTPSSSIRVHRLAPLRSAGARAYAPFAGGQPASVTVSESTRGEGSEGVLVAREVSDSATSSQRRRQIAESMAGTAGPNATAASRTCPGRNARDGAPVETHVPREPAL